jgi:serine/threonine protein phosphatase PrpC
MHPPLLDSAELTDVGRLRENNEDNCLRLPDLGVFCVADGMGGAAGGDVASEAITTHLREALERQPGLRAAPLAKRVRAVREAVDRANRWIKDFSDERVLGVMGSTVVALVIDPRSPQTAVGLHAGDSRLYRHRRGQLDLLTCDHTTAEELVARSGWNPADIPARYQNELTRAVGIRDSLDLAETRIDVAPGDLFLLCSDGLNRMLEDDAILRILSLAEDHSLGEIASRLVSEANLAGGKDNITVVLVRVGHWTEASDKAIPNENNGDASNDATSAHPARAGWKWLPFRFRRSS